MIDPRDHGAVADATADCTEALQRAADGGEGVRLSAGIYRIRRSIEIDLAKHGRCSVVGDGTATILMDGPGPALNLIGTHHGTAAPASVTPGVYASERSPRIAGIEIVGAHPDAVGVSLQHCFKPILTGLFIRRCAVGIHLVERNRDVLIDHCHIYDCPGEGIFLDKVDLHQINICNCHVSYNRRGGIVVRGGSVRNLQIAGCDIEYNFDRDDLERESADVWIETAGESVREGAITGCTIQAMASRNGANVRFVGESAEVAHKVGLFSITGNLISSQETQVHLKYARGVTITGNTFFSGHARNILCEHSSNVVISGNVFDHNPDYAKETLDGIEVRHSRGVTMTGNHFSAITHPDGVIRTADCTDLLLANNQFLDSTGPDVGQE